MKSKLGFEKLVLVFLFIIALILSALSWLVSLNEYEAMGMFGAIDCDGPITVLIFAIPALVITMLSILYLVIRLKKVRSYFYWICLVLFLLLDLLATFRLLQVYQVTIENREQHSWLCD